MASKKTAKKPARPTTPVARIGAALGRGEPVEAFELAVEEFNKDRIANAALLLSTFQKSTAQLLADAEWEECQRLLLDVLKVERADPEWVRELAIRMAQSGGLTKANELASAVNDPSLPTLLLGHNADFALRTNNANAIPELHRPAFEAIRTAFGHYRAKADDVAREALNAVGLQSPFLEWKVLLRGLIAWTGNDSSKALENFGRLNAERIPAKLAAPFRYRIDPAFADSQSEEQRRILGLAYLAFDRNGLPAKLRTLLPLFSIRKNLQPLFKALDPLVTSLRKEGPSLVPRLENAVYYTIQRGGQPDDLNRYLKVFGPPRNDPEFQKLSSIVFEELEDFESALKCWAKYESWLATGAANWPEPIAKRSRAIVLNRMGGLAEDSEEDPRPFYRRAVKLAPDFERANRELFAQEVIAGDLEAGEKAAREYLKFAPQSPEMLSGLSSLLRKRGKLADAFEFQKRALAVNPLDAGQRSAFAVYLIAFARTEAMAGRLKEALGHLGAHGSVPVESNPVLYFALRAAIHAKLGDPATADTDRAGAMTSNASRLVALFAIAVISALLKCKPKDKAAANKAYLEEFALLPDAKSLLRVAMAAELFGEEGAEYPWFKTQAKKILVEIGMTGERAGEEREFEALAKIVVEKPSTPAIQTWLKQLMKRFPKNPHFPYALGKLMLKKTKGPMNYKIRQLLTKAQDLTEGSADPSLRPMIEDLKELLFEEDPFADFFKMFGRR